MPQKVICQVWHTTTLSVKKTLHLTEFDLYQYLLRSADRIRKGEKPVLRQTIEVDEETYQELLNNQPLHGIEFSEFYSIME